MNRSAAIADIRARLRAGGVSVGSWIQIPNGSVAEIMGAAGYEWVAVDMEHGSISASQLPDLFRGLELGGTLPLVRVLEGNAKECKIALDAGAGGVIAPMVESAEQLLAIRNAMCWPPAGTRGVGFSRANLFGQKFADYAVEAQAPLMVAMIEHVRAIDNLEEILQVEGLDAVLIGPYDLSASMGLTARFQETKFAEAMARILELAKRAGVAAGIHIVHPSESDLTKRLAEGYRFIAYSIDSVLLAGASLRPALANEEKNR